MGSLLNVLSDYWGLSTLVDWYLTVWEQDWLFSVLQLLWRSFSSLYSDHSCSDFWNFILHICFLVFSKGLRGLPSIAVVSKYLFIWLVSASGLSCRTQDFCLVTRDLWLQCTGFLLVALRFSCSTACRILVPWPGIEPLSLALQGRFITIGPPGKSS